MRVRAVLLGVVTRITVQLVVQELCSVLALDDKVVPIGDDDIPGVVPRIDATEGHTERAPP